jgi:hypothetical protein
VSGETGLAYSLALLLVIYGGGILPGAILWLLPARTPQTHEIFDAESPVTQSAGFKGKGVTPDGL